MGKMISVMGEMKIPLGETLNHAIFRRGIETESNYITAHYFFSDIFINSSTVASGDNSFALLTASAASVRE